VPALWAEPHVTFKGKWHTIEDAGINPLPTARKIPSWYGGHADVTLRRCAKWGNGWMPLAYPPGEEARTAFATLPRYADEAGRDPASASTPGSRPAPTARPNGARRCGSGNRSA